MYCEKCCRVFQGGGSVCPTCGSRKIREPWAEDPCFLVEKGSPWAEMLADVLTKNDIPFMKQPVLGAGIALKLGHGMERWRFYVLHPGLEEAQELLARLFPSE